MSKSSGKSDVMASILAATTGRVLIFVNTKVAADELAHTMNNRVIPQTAAAEAGNAQRIRAHVVVVVAVVVRP